MRMIAGLILVCRIIELMMEIILAILRDQKMDFTGAVMVMNLNQRTQTQTKSDYTINYEVNPFPHKPYSDKNENHFITAKI